MTPADLPDPHTEALFTAHQPGSPLTTRGQESFQWGCNELHEEERNCPGQSQRRESFEREACANPVIWCASVGVGRGGGVVCYNYSPQNKLVTCTCEGFFFFLPPTLHSRIQTWLKHDTGRTQPCGGSAAAVELPRI